MKCLPSDNDEFLQCVSITAAERPKRHAHSRCNIQIFVFIYHKKHLRWTVSPFIERAVYWQFKIRCISFLVVGQRSSRWCQPQVFCTRVNVHCVVPALSKLNCGPYVDSSKVFSTVMFPSPHQSTKPILLRTHFTVLKLMDSRRRLLLLLHTCLCINTMRGLKWTVLSLVSHHILYTCIYTTYYTVYT